jgi:putative salt-induced outer membrane protein YdiY
MEKKPGFGTVATDLAAASLCHARQGYRSAAPESCTMAPMHGGSDKSMQAAASPFFSGPRTLFLLLALCASKPALAIVNIEDIRAKTPPEGVSGRFDLSATSLSGNSSGLHVSTGGRVNWKRGEVLDFVVGSYDFGETSGVRDVDKSFLHGRHVVTLNPRWAWEGFGQIEQDQFRRLNYRALLGGGVRRTLMKTDDKAAWFGIGAFYSTEELSGDGTENRWRANLYLVWKHALGTHTHFATTTYCQPAVNDVTDYRLSEEAGLTVSMTRTLDLAVTLNVYHDSQPPAGVKQTDVSFTTGIKYRF